MCPYNEQNVWNCFTAYALSSSQRQFKLTDMKFLLDPAEIKNRQNKNYFCSCNIKTKVPKKNEQKILPQDDMG